MCHSLQELLKRQVNCLLVSQLLVACGQSLVHPLFLVNECFRVGMTVLSTILLGPFPQAEVRHLAAYRPFNPKIGTGFD